ncbi:hypothetical protein [Altericroceibacterium spongiae]|uniref:hypothetical protein n=1 Tax=Altericroceibacterium spongiae TaxID=2320269 RepID=UPI001600DA08|nr:hypothetical protein [Altericroceibacterium spongiae]
MIATLLHSRALAGKLAEKARHLAEAAIIEQAHTRRSSPEKWRDPRLLWPLIHRE